MSRKDCERSGRGMCQDTFPHGLCKTRAIQVLPLNSAYNLGEVIGKTHRTRYDFCNFTMREEHRLTVFENRVLKSIFGPKEDGLDGTGGSCTSRNFMTCTPHQISFE
jgi:hypothetical protein